MIRVAVWRDGEHQTHEFADETLIRIGRSPDADIRLLDPYVSAGHAVLKRNGKGLHLRASGTNPTWLGDRRVPDDEWVEVGARSVVAISAFKLCVLDGDPQSADLRHAVLVRAAEIERKLYERTFEKIDFRAIGLLPEQATQQGLEILRDSFSAVMAETGTAISEDGDAVNLVLARLFRRLVLRRLAQQRVRTLGASAPRELPQADMQLAVFLEDPVVSEVVAGLIRRIDDGLKDTDVEGRERARSDAVLADWFSFGEQVAAAIPRRMRENLLREELFRRIVNLAFELGPLEDLVDVPNATEILVNGPDKIYLETDAGLRRLSDSFPSADALRRILQRAVSRAGRRLDASQPLVDVQMADGSRLNAVIDPLSRSGDIISIRRFRADPLTLQSMQANGTVDAKVARLLTALILARKNLVISGGTGSGKTTLLGAIANQIGPDERLVIIEDTAEIRLPAEAMHAVFLQARQPNVEGKGEVTIRRLIRNALRMRPDRIIVGECRGQEVIDMLQAMNTGHPGSITTVHANSPREVIGRIEMMCQQGIELPIDAVRRYIAMSIHVIVQVARGADGRRRVQEIAEVRSMNDGRIEVVPILALDPSGQVPTPRFTGNLPTFIQELETANLFRAEAFLDE